MLHVKYFYMQELHDVPLFVSLHNLCGTLKCTSPSAVMFRSAVINAGYRISGSHVNPLGLKSDAPMDVIWNIMRCWVLAQPRYWLYTFLESSNYFNLHAKLAFQTSYKKDLIVVLPGGFIYCCVSHNRSRIIQWKRSHQISQEPWFFLKNQHCKWVFPSLAVMFSSSFT